ncbi:hypothetical protein SAMN05192549_11733 [Duganella sacchari]|uniref:Uncharacterized protein n=1 Tax=Duganella sacchari TaxID=551987 RepID=A0A1M7RBD9_9BURK|nr:hypothetical protein [Duganella sacchari]SHN43490.1 hypothetical protein SAMN05192549_11733 [Duganella sacchari]
MSAAIIGVIIIIVMVVQDVLGVFRHMFGDKRQPMTATAAQYVREIAIRRRNRLQREYQHQQYQEGFFHCRAIIAAAFNQTEQI